MPERGRGGTPFLSIPNNSQETAKPAGKHPSCTPGGRAHGPSARGGARPGRSRGVRGTPPPQCHRHPEPTGCPLWQRGRKERGTAPTSDTATPDSAGSSCQLPGTDPGLRASAQPDSDRQRGQDRRTAARGRAGGANPSIPQTVPCSVGQTGTKSHGTQHSGAQDTPQGDPRLDFRAGLVPPPSRLPCGALTASGRCCPLT